MHEVAADTQESAFDQLRTRGLRDLNLLSDELATAIGAHFGAGSGRGVKLNAEQKALLLDGSWRSAAWIFLRKSAWEVIPAALFLLVRFTTSSWGRYEGLAHMLDLAALFVLLAASAIFWWHGRTGRRFDRLERAVARGQWPRALTLAAKLEASKVVAIPAFLLDFYRGGAELGLGRVDQGLALFARHSDDPALAPWVFLAMRARLEQRAGRNEAARHSLEQALELEPSSAEIKLQLAELLVLQGEPETARAHFAAVANATIGVGSRWTLEFVEGLLALASAEDRAARFHFEAAERRLKALGRLAFSPLAAAQIQVGLATALARLGENDKARRLWERAEPLLKPHGYEALLDQCRLSVSGATSSGESPGNSKRPP